MYFGPKSVKFGFQGLEKSIFIGSSFRFCLRFRQFWFTLGSLRLKLEGSRKGDGRKRNDPIRSFRLRFVRASACVFLFVFMVHTRTQGLLRLRFRLRFRFRRQREPSSGLHVPLALLLLLFVFFFQFFYRSIFSFKLLSKFLSILQLLSFSFSYDVRVHISSCFQYSTYSHFCSRCCSSSPFLPLLCNCL